MQAHLRPRDLQVGKLRQGEKRPAAHVNDRALRGRFAESIVADYLFAKGFRVLASNLRLGPLELDLVARQGALLVVVEVRTRGGRSFTSGFGSVTAEKRARLLRATERLLLSRAITEGVERVRIDVAQVTFDDGVVVEYVPGAITR